MKEVHDVLYVNAIRMQTAAYIQLNRIYLLYRSLQSKYGKEWPTHYSLHEWYAHLDRELEKATQLVPKEQLQALMHTAKKYASSLTKKEAKACREYWLKSAKSLDI